MGLINFFIRNNKFDRSIKLFFDFEKQLLNLFLKLLSCQVNNIKYKEWIKITFDTILIMSPLLKINRIVVEWWIITKTFFILIFL